MRRMQRSNRVDKHFERTFLATLIRWNDVNFSVQSNTLVVQVGVTWIDGEGRFFETFFTWVERGCWKRCGGGVDWNSRFVRYNFFRKILRWKGASKEIILELLDHKRFKFNWRAITWVEMAGFRCFVVGRLKVEVFYLFFCVKSAFIFCWQRVVYPTYFIIIFLKSFKTAAICSCNFSR